jgi:predicted aldo/keto reductase-like oxidoreductase
MSQKANGFSRRRFLKVAGAAGLGSLVVPAADARTHALPHLARTDDIQAPTRPFGKSGRQVSILSMGGMFDIAANQLMLKQTVRWGITYWDTADCYHRGSEAGIGKYFAKNPQDRQKIFLVTKSDARNPQGMDELLNRSLQRMNTDYIDLYFIHGLRHINEINDDTRRWAEKRKAEKKIRLFGFSTHSNMEECMLDAAKLGWIDGIMMSYNYRNMHSDKMKAAVQACVDAGIGLTAMKTQGGSSWIPSGKNDLVEHFMKRGMTEEQAKLKAVWENPHIASICSQMDSMKLLKANAAAACDPTPLSSRDRHVLQQYAVASANTYCAGCSDVCAAAVGGRAPVGDIMRYHMYCRSYGRSDWARTHVQQLPDEVRQQMADLDYSEAERRCPQKLPIARLMREAVDYFWV